jgi:hypothetical protein
VSTGLKRYRVRGTALLYKCHTHTYTHIHTNRILYNRIYTYLYGLLCEGRELPYTHIHTQLHTHTYTHTYLYGFLCEGRQFPLIHTHTYTITYTYIHIHTHTLLHLRTCMAFCVREESSLCWGESGLPPEPEDS